MSKKVPIIVVDSDKKEHTFIATKQPTVIGRSNKADIKINDDYCSGTHCRVFMNSKGQVVIEDLDSRNGVSIHGNKRSVHKLYLKESAVIGNSFIMINESQLTETQKDHYRFSKSDEDRSFAHMTLELEKSYNTEKRNKMINSLKDIPLAGKKRASLMNAKESKLSSKSKLRGRKSSYEKKIDQINKVTYILLGLFSFMGLNTVLVIVDSFFSALLLVIIFAVINTKFLPRSIGEFLSKII